jgi:hypothetical protein
MIKKTASTDPSRSQDFSRNGFLSLSHLQRQSSLSLFELVEIHWSTKEPAMQVGFLFPSKPFEPKRDLRENLQF